MTWNRSQQTLSRHWKGQANKQFRNYTLQREKSWKINDISPNLTCELTSNYFLGFQPLLPTVRVSEATLFPISLNDNLKKINLQQCIFRSMKTQHIIRWRWSCYSSDHKKALERVLKRSLALYATQQGFKYDYRKTNCLTQQLMAWLKANQTLP